MKIKLELYVPFTKNDKEIILRRPFIFLTSFLLVFAVFMSYLQNETCRKTYAFSVKGRNLSSKMRMDAETGKSLFSARTSLENLQREILASYLMKVVWFSIPDSHPERYLPMAIKSLEDAEKEKISNTVALKKSAEILDRYVLKLEEQSGNKIP